MPSIERSSLAGRGPWRLDGTLELAGRWRRHAEPDLPTPLPDPTVERSLGRHGEKRRDAVARRLGGRKGVAIAGGRKRATGPAEACCVSPAPARSRGRRKGGEGRRGAAAKAGGGRRAVAGDLPLTWCVQLRENMEEKRRNEEREGEEKKEKEKVKKYGTH